MDTPARLAWLIALSLSTTACRSVGEGRAAGDAQREAAAVLDELHRLAATADGEAYFALFEEGAIYLGTDASERWTLEQFRAFAEPYFSRGQGWTYVASERHLYASADDRTVWFDERLHNASYGECRGSGVLVRGASGWRIAHYVLSLPVPNELARELVGRIRALPRSAAPAPGGGGL